MAKKSAQRKGQEPSNRLEQDEKIIPIDPETAEIVTEQKRLFREKFGREPGPKDPLFFDPDAATPQFLSAERQAELWKSLVQAAGDSGIDPALVYAMNKTGRIVTHDNLKFLTDAELQEWNDALDEYHQKIESGKAQ
jgi:hypothetical protein